MGVKEWDGEVEVGDIVAVGNMRNPMGMDMFYILTINANIFSL